MSLSRVNIVGAGPAGLLCAILLRRALPDTSVHVFEKNPRGATFGFGVVFSDQALDFLRTDDPDTHALLLSSVQRWQDMTLNHPGGQVTVDGVGFAAIGRLTLLEMLCKRATALGAELHFDTTIRSLSDLEGDLIVGADGLNSIVRKSAVERFKPSVEEFTNRFAWFGASVPFETLTQSFVNTPLGPFNAHHYRYAPDQSTFIVECQEPVFAAYGFDRMSETDSAHTCSTVFSEVLNGSRLVTNHSAWRRFPKLWCANWVSDRTVLLGDAAHTAHFSIGSGTRLAMEDAIALVNALVTTDDVDAALENYQSTRQPVVQRLVNAANTSASWYERFDRPMALSPLEFAFDYITRSGRVDRAKLRRMAPAFMATYEAAFS